MNCKKVATEKRILTAVLMTLCIGCVSMSIAGQIKTSLLQNQSADVMYLNEAMLHKSRPAQEPYNPPIPTSPPVGIDTLTWRKEGASKVINFGFNNSLESLLVWLNPEAACSLLAIRFKPGDWEGSMLLDIWDASNYTPLIHSTDSTDTKGWIGRFEPNPCLWPPCEWIPGDIMGHSPLRWSKNDPEHHYWGPVPYTLTSEHANKWVVISADIALQGRVDLGNNPFYIGAVFFPVRAWGFYAQEPYQGSTPFNFFKFYPGYYGPTYHGGWYIRSYQLWFEAVVKYYENTPPRFKNLKVQNYTYGPGPFPITVLIEDWDVEDQMRAGVSFAELVININGIEDRIRLEGPSEGGLYQSFIPELAFGDTVTYWVEATDIAGLSSQSNMATFARILPRRPSADILIIWDYKWNADLDTFLVDLFEHLERWYNYELWNIDEQNGIDASVITWGWNTIVVSGWGCKHTLPGRYCDGNPFAEWLDDGPPDYSHNLLYIDQDYFCVHQEYGCDWAEQLNQGDFLHDYFGVVFPVSDPVVGFGNEAIGIGDFDGINVNFFPNSFDPTEPEENLKSDYIIEVTNDAELIFKYKYTNFGAGVRLDRGGYKTVYLPWQDFFAVDSSKKGDLVPRQELVATIDKILKWFKTGVGIDSTLSETNIPQRYDLAQNYPNPFNSTTDIKYQIVNTGPSIHTTLKIYDILGHEVRTLVNEYKEPGNYIVRWNGRDNYGNEASSGVYFYQLKVGDFVETKRMLLLR